MASQVHSELEATDQHPLALEKAAIFHKILFAVLNNVSQLENIWTIHPYPF